MRGKLLPGRVHRALQHVLIIGLVIFGSLRVNAQDTIVIHFGCQQVVQGDQICIPVIADHFINVTTFSLNITWDPQVLHFNTIQNQQFTDGASNAPGPSDLRYIWGDGENLGHDLPDGTVLFEICFTAIGIPGETSTIDGPQFVLNPFNTIEFATPDAEIIQVEVTPCTVDIINPVTVTASIDVCGSPDGVADGTFTITASGGTPPYTYSWSGPANGSSALSMVGASESQSVPPGNYTITINDNSGGSIMYQITIGASELVPAISIAHDVSCFNFSNGRIEVGTFGGTYPVSVLWRHLTNPLYHGSGYIQTDGGFYTLNSLPVGDYEIIMIDNSGCLRIDTVSLTASPIVIDAMATDATCLGETDGSVAITFSGGNPYNGGIYQVTPGWGSGGSFMTTAPLNSAPVFGPGDFWVQVCDSVNGCCARDTFTVGADTVVSAAFLAEHPSCAGIHDARLRVTGLTEGLILGPYNIQLFDANKIPVQPPINNVTLAQFTNLAPGNYFVVVKDGMCRSDTLPITVPDVAPIVINLLNVTPSGCIVGQNTGEITASASGGTPNYNYVWDGGALSGAMVSGLTAGNHFLTVTDANGCSQQLTVNVPQGVPPVITDIIATGVGCSGEDVTLEVIYTEGTAPVNSIQWSTGGTTPIITGVMPGSTVNVTIRDSLFCFDIASFDVPDKPVIVIDSVVAENPTCGGDADGQFAVFVSQGVEPYTFIWSTGDTTAFNLLAGLTAGTYSVTILGSDTCNVMVDTSVTLTDQPIPQFVFSGVVEPSCFDSCNGAATLTPMGGIPGFPYTFLWDAGPMQSGMQSTVQNLCAGYQRVVITQDNFCYYEDSVLIPSPVPVGFDTVTLTNVTCYGLSDGMISIHGTGGTGPYQYAWDIPGTDSTQNGLAAGMYQLTVTDANGCAVEDSVAISQPDSLILSIDSSGLRPISCNSANSGVITVQTEGGNGGYTYMWNPNVSMSNIASGVSVGTYMITATDAKGCTDTTSITLTGPSPVIGFLPMIDDPLCFGDLTPVTVDSAVGGAGGYTWSVNGGQPHALDSLAYLPAGIYNIITQDSSGCRDTVQIFLNNPPPLEIVVTPSNPIVGLGDSIQLQVFVQGMQVPVDSVSWVSNGPISCNDCIDPYVMNVIPTVYTVTVWDSNGCSASVDVLVDVDNRREVYIPNVFSPNFDGRNDEMLMFTGQGVTGIPSMRIFDRWGELVTEHLNVSPDPGGVVVWDGMFNDKMMAPGVYVYYIQVQFANGDVLNYRGDVTLLR